MGQEEQVVVEHRSKKNILLGSVLGYISLIINVLAGIFFTPWIIQTIGDGQYGLYTLSSTLVAFFLMDFGLSIAVNSFLAKYRAKGQTEEIQKFLGTIYKVYLIIDALILAVLAVVYFLIPVIYQGLTASEIVDFKIIFLITAGFSLISFPCTPFNGILSAYENFAFLKLTDIIQKILFVAFTTISLLLNLGLYFLVISNCLSGLICFGAKYFYIRFKNKVRADLKAKSSRADVIKLISFSIWAALISIASRIAFTLTPSILGIVSNSTEIAVFGICSVIEGYVYTFGTVISGFFLSKISRLKEQNPEEYTKQLQKLAIKFGKIQFLIVAMILFGFILVGREFIFVWMKHDITYDRAYLGIILCIAYLPFSIPQIIFNSAVYLTKDIKYLAIAEFVGAAINIGLAFWLGSLYGCVGACLAILISRVFTLVISNIVYKNTLKVSIFGYFLGVYGSCTAAVLLSFVFCLGIQKMISDFSGTLYIIVLGCIFVLVFCICSVIFVLDKEEMNALKNAIFKRRKR